MQPIYFVAESFVDAKKRIIEYCENINRPFNVSYNTKTDTVEVDRKIRTREEFTDENTLVF